MSDDEIEGLFAEARWGSKTEQACPKCGLFRAHYRRKSRKQWRCSAVECSHEFSITSGTVWHKHKLSLRDILTLTLLFEVAAKGVPVLEIARAYGVTPKTATVALGKQRESIIRTYDISPLEGTVHLDGGYFGGKMRKPNRRRGKITPEMIAVRYGKAPPKDSSKPWVSAGMSERNWLKKANKRVVMALCDSAGAKQGSRRTLPFVCRSENTDDVKLLAKHFIHKDAVVMTDENPAFNVLAESHDHRRVRHAKEYATRDGVSDNMAETAFSRLRRAEIGTFHSTTPKYLQDRAMEFGWRETNRRVNQRERILLLLKSALGVGRSLWWTGYWQGHNRSGEIELRWFLDKLKSSR